MIEKINYKEHIKEIIEDCNKKWSIPSFSYLDEEIIDKLNQVIDVLNGITNLPVGCQHQWDYDYTTSRIFRVCKRCGLQEIY